MCKYTVPKLISGPIANFLSSVHKRKSLDSSGSFRNITVISDDLIRIPKKSSICITIQYLCCIFTICKKPWSILFKLNCLKWTLYVYNMKNLKRFVQLNSFSQGTFVLCFLCLCFVFVRYMFKNKCSSHVYPLSNKTAIDYLSKTLVSVLRSPIMNC